MQLYDRAQPLHRALFSGSKRKEILKFNNDICINSGPVANIKRVLSNLKILASRFISETGYILLVFLRL